VIISSLPLPFKNFNKRLKAKWLEFFFQRGLYGELSPITFLKGPRKMTKRLILTFLILFTISGCGVRSIPQALNQVEAAWAEVTNQYKRRADLIPNLVKVVQGYAAHEKETLEAVINARAKATQTNVSVENLNQDTMQAFQKAQGNLGSALGRLMLIVERYPDLKANQNFRDLQIQLEGTENRIATARRRYIEAIQHFNNQISVPPESFTNSLFYHHKKKPQFAVEGEPDLDKPPEINL
jgi:LemA protein